MRTKLEGYRIECNICPDAICLTHSEIPYIYEGRLVKILENYDLKEKRNQKLMK
jgi:hypothetical protein